MRITKEFIVHPDEIKRLRTGEAIVLRKNPEFKVQRTKVIYLGKKAEELEAPTAAYETQEDCEAENGDPLEHAEWFVLTKKKRRNSKDDSKQC